MKMPMNVQAPPSEAILVMNRIFEAPRELVWAAFTTPKHVSKWYGGVGFSSPVCEMDVRPGGIWRHTMRTPSGAEYAMEFVYVDVIAPEKLSWKSSRPADALKQQGMLNVFNTVTLEADGARTKWQLVARFDSIAERDLAKKNGFSNVIAEGSEKLNEIVKGLAAPADARGALSAPRNAHALAVGTFLPMLRSLLDVLAKGRAHATARSFDVAVLAAARLAPDMFTLRQQVQLACHHANDAVARLTGREPAVHVTAEESFDELEARVATTIDALKTVPEAAFDGSEARAIVIPLPGGEIAFEMTGEQFLRDWALPHFYFHLVTAYDLLRHNGVAIGKRDYVSHVGVYLRPQASGAASTAR